ncbi:unnamed protein product [Closterium sp. NIES-53]
MSGLIPLFLEGHVWRSGPALVGGTDRERYFLLVVDDYIHYTTVFLLRRKADVSGVLIPWIRATRRQLPEQFSRNFSVLCLHSDRGGEFSSGLLAEFCRDEGIVQSFMLPASPQQNGIAERRIGLIMEGALSLVRNAKASKLSSRTLRCVFLGFPTDTPPWQFYHPRERRVFSSKDVTFEESVYFYRLHTHASHPLRGVTPPLMPRRPLAALHAWRPPLVFLLRSSSPPPQPADVDSGAEIAGPEPRGAETEDPLPPQGPAPSGVSQLRGVTPPLMPRRPLAALHAWRPPLVFLLRSSSPPPQPADVDSGAEIAGPEPRGAETEGEGSRGAAIGGAAIESAGSGGAASPSGGGVVGDPAGGPGAGQPPQRGLLETLSPQAIRAWIVWRGSPGGGGYGPAGASPGGTAGAGGIGGTAGGARGVVGAGGTRGAAGAGGAGATSPRGATSAGGAGPTSPGGTAGAGGARGDARARGAGAGGTRVARAAGAGGAVSAGVAGGTGAAGTGGGGATGAGAAGAAGPQGARTRDTEAAGAPGSASAGGATGAVGNGGVGAAGAGGARAGAAGASGAAGAGSAGGARGATGATGTGGAGGTAGAGGTRGTGGAGAAGPGGARTRDTGAAGAAGAASAGGASGAAGTGGARAGGAAGESGAAGAGSAGGARGATGAAGTGGAGGTAGAGGTGGTGGAGAAGPRGAHTRGAGAARAGGAAGAGGVGGPTGATGTGGAGCTAGVRGAGDVGACAAAGAGGATGAVGAGGGGAAGAGGAGGAGTAPRRLFFYPQPQSSLPPPDSVLRQILSLPSSTGLTPPLLYPPTDQSQPQLLPGSPLPPAPHTEVSESLTEHREPETCTSTPFRARRVVRPRPPAVPGTHSMALRPSSVPQRVVLPKPPASSLPHVPDPKSNLARAPTPTVTRLIATVVNDPDFESTAAFALVAKLVDFAARSRLNYVASLVTESECVCPPSVGGEPALSSDVLEDMQFELEVLRLLYLVSHPCCFALRETRMHLTSLPRALTLRRSRVSTPLNGRQPWTQRWLPGSPQAPTVKRPPGSSSAFKARYVARGFSQRQGVDFFQTFSPTPKMTTLRVLMHVAAQRDYELHSLDFSTAFLQGSLHEEIWLHRPPGFTGSFPAGTQWSFRQPVYGLYQAPREWQDTLMTTLAALGFAPSSAYPSLFLRTDTTLPPFYVLLYVDNFVFAIADTEALALVLQRFAFQFSSSQPTPLSTRLLLSAPPSDESVESGGPYRELVGCLMYLMTCTRPELAYPLSFLTRYVAPVHRAWSSCLEDRVQCCEAEIYAGVMATQELRWLTYLLTDLGERPRSPPVLYVDNKAILALCHEQRLEHRMKHIALRYFLARELQQRRQLRFSYVASRANIANVFTKALGSGDHQRFCTALGLVPTLPHLLVA